MAQVETESDQRSFGPVHIIDPKADHTYTAVMLHGRGSTGEEFAEEMLGSKLSDGCSLFEKLPNYRWVFPSSRELWSTAFQEDMSAWFEAHSLTDITARQDLQVGGIRDSVNYIIEIINEEVRRLDGDAQRLVLGGISQGGAIASAWLPFATNTERLFSEQRGSNKPQEAEFDSFVEQMVAVKTTNLSKGPDGLSCSLL